MKNGGKLPTECSFHICSNRFSLFPKSHFSTKALICFVSSCPIRSEDMLNTPRPPHIYSKCSVVLLLHLPTWQLNQWIAPKQLFVSVCPPLNILYAHLRAISTSNCLRGYYNDQPTHCAVLTVVLSCWEFKWGVLHFPYPPPSVCPHNSNNLRQIIMWSCHGNVFIGVVG